MATRKFNEKKDKEHKVIFQSKPDASKTNRYLVQDFDIDPDELLFVEESLPGMDVVSSSGKSPSPVAQPTEKKISKSKKLKMRKERGLEDCLRGLIWTRLFGLSEIIAIS